MIRFKCSSEYWTPSNIRNGRLSTSCSVGSNNQALTFGESIIFKNNNFSGFIVTHAALTNVFPINNITSNERCQSSTTHSLPTTISSYIITTSTISDTISNTLPDTMSSTTNKITAIEDDIKRKVNNDCIQISLKDIMACSANSVKCILTQSDKNSG